MKAVTARGLAHRFAHRLDHRLAHRLASGTLALIALLTISQPLLATNVDREKRWVEQTVDSIFDGEPLFLQAGDHRFLSIYTESDTPTDKGMIVVHGTGFHPDWEQVVQPVRVEMTRHGWNTLSIQMPILEKNAHYEDYIALYPELPARFHAATEYLREKGMNKIAIVAHSQGGTMASYFVAYPNNESQADSDSTNRETSDKHGTAANSSHNIDALVVIGMSAQYMQPHVNSAESLRHIDIPVLDIFGSKDFAAVLATTEKRAEGAAHNKQYSQQLIENAYHFFDDHETELIDVIVKWLNKYF